MKVLNKISMKYNKIYYMFVRPPFIGDDSYHKQHRRRLYDKDNKHYDIFKDDMSTKEIENKVNYYCIPSNNGGYNIVKYLNGKKI